LQAPDLTLQEGVLVLQTRHPALEARYFDGEESGEHQDGDLENN
jgi:hypothetical protein